MYNVLQIYRILCYTIFITGRKDDEEREGEGKELGGRMTDRVEKRKWGKVKGGEGRRRKRETISNFTQLNKWFD